MILKLIGQCDVKQIMIFPIKTIMLVLKILTTISITVCPIGNLCLEFISAVIPHIAIKKREYH
jgi:hypothetical protein